MKKIPRESLMPESGHKIFYTKIEEPVIETCELGHKFAKLQDHPKKDGLSRCPHCMAIGLDAAREKNERQLEAILSFIDEGVDELLVRRIWERALRA